MVLATPYLLLFDNSLMYYTEAMKIAREELMNIYEDWTNRKWEELDWDRIRELQTRDLLEYRNQEAKKAQLGHCFDCPNFVKHVSDANGDLG